MARQLCCRGMCKNLLRSDGQQRSYGKAKFPSNLNCGQKTVSETGPRLIYLFFVTHDLCFIIDPQKPQLSLCFMLFVYFYPSPPISTALNILISYVTRISWCSSVASKFDAVDWMWSMLHHKPKSAIHGWGEGGSSWIIGLNPWISSHRDPGRNPQDIPRHAKALSCLVVVRQLSISPMSPRITSLTPVATFTNMVLQHG